MPLQKGSKLLEYLEQDAGGQRKAKRVLEALEGDNILRHKDKVQHWDNLSSLIMQMGSHPAYSSLGMEVSS